MIHKMNLNDEPFNSIKNGFKTIEIDLIRYLIIIHCSPRYLKYLKQTSYFHKTLR